MSTRPCTVITGAASGIGRATAELFVARGYGVVAVDPDESALAGLDGVVPVAGDASAEEANQRAVDVALSRFGRLDVAVLNAGIGGAPALDADGAIDRLDRIYAVNLRGIALGMRVAIPVMHDAGGGAVVVTASVAGLRADPYTWAYNATKAAAINLVRAAAIDYGHLGIRVNAIAPGLTTTPRTQRVRDRAELAADLTRTIPLQRWGAPSEQAEVIYFLASPAASYITGAVIPCDGGLSASNGFMLPPPASDDFR